MNHNPETKPMTESLRAAMDDLAGHIDTLTVRLGESADLAAKKLRSMEGAAADLASDLEPHGKRMLRATEDFAREARRSYERVVTGEKRRWYWPFQ